MDARRSKPKLPACAAILALVSIFATRLFSEDGADPSREPFSFVQMCDTQLGMGGYEHDVGTFKQAVKKINAMDPDFVVICGDLVQKADDKSFADFNEIKSAFKLPCYCAAGNHDVENKPTAESLKKYREKVGRDYYDFEHKGFTFVVANTQLWKAPLAGESEKHDAWFKKSLEDAKAKDSPVIVVVHYPFFVKDPDEKEQYFNLPVSKRKELLSLCKDNGVVAILGGHLHKFQAKEYEGIKLVNGETTSKNFDKRPMGFRWWDVDGKGEMKHRFVGLDEAGESKPAPEVRRADPPARKPNVIVIFTDDQGSVDAGCYGTKDIETPNIDKLAERGSRFTQFYAAAPVCSPSRAGLLTGRYPLRAGVPGNTTSVKGQPGMPGEQVTIAEHFKAAGYNTAHIGKWHLGYIPEHMPNAQGFDHSFGHMGGCIDNYSHFFYWQGPNRHDLHRNGEEIFADGKFFPDLMVEEACDFIKENQADPFFIYFAMNTPHYPYQGEAHWLERYKDLPEQRKLYNAFVSTLDARIGSLMHYLDEVGLREETIVVFQSDHGHSTEDRAHNGGGSSGPYRGAKFSLFEGGIRVPAIISWPGKLPEGKVFSQLAHSCDWLPTLADLSGIKLAEGGIDGLSLAPLLNGESDKSPHGIVHWQVGRGNKAQWAVRDADWKLIGNVRDTSKPKAEGDPVAGLYLSNLAKDPSEKRNHAQAEPEIVERLKAAHEDWLKTISP